MSRDPIIDGMRKIANGAKQALRVGAAVSDALESGEQAFAKTHGGRKPATRTGWAGGKGVPPHIRTAAPNTNVALIEMGALTRIAYLADKGDGLVEHFHDFEIPYPMLCYASDGSGLVIARGDSRYTITQHGIEG